MQKARPIIPAGACPVLEFLYEDRKITASGRETTDTDPGLAMIEGRLFARDLYSEHELLPDRVADKPDACDLTWSKMCSVELTASCGTNEDKHK